jgi:hypothetical protein
MYKRAPHVPLTPVPLLVHTINISIHYGAHTSHHRNPQAHDQFIHRHIGPTHKNDVDRMLKLIGMESVAELIDATVPDSIRFK